MGYFVWMITRKIRAGALDDFERVWQPNPYPEGLARAYACWSEDGQEIIGVSFWDSKGIMRRLARLRGREAAPPSDGALRARGPGSVLPRSGTGHSRPAKVIHRCVVPYATLIWTPTWAATSTTPAASHSSRELYQHSRWC
jgi:hypothetical protein